MGHVEWDRIYRLYANGSTNLWSLKPSPRVLRYSRRLPKDSIVLDVGCGIGRNVKVLLERGFNVVALDISNTALKFLKRCIDALDGPYSGRLTLVYSDARGRIPLKSNIADMVIDSFTFTFITNKRKYLSEVFRVLRGGGFFLLEFDMSPRILKPAKLVDIVQRSLKCLDSSLYDIVDFEVFYHRWGNIADESMHEVPAIFYVFKKKN